MALVLVVDARFCARSVVRSLRPRRVRRDLANTISVRFACTSRDVAASGPICLRSRRLNHHASTRWTFARVGCESIAIGVPAHPDPPSPQATSLDPDGQVHRLCEPIGSSKPVGRASAARRATRSQPPRGRVRSHRLGGRRATDSHRVRGARRRLPGTAGNSCRGNLDSIHHLLRRCLHRRRGSVRRRRCVSTYLEDSAASPPADPSAPGPCPISLEPSAARGTQAGLEHSRMTCGQASSALEQPSWRANPALFRTAMTPRIAFRRLPDRRATPAVANVPTLRDRFRSVARRGRWQVESRHGPANPTA